MAWRNVLFHGLLSSSHKRSKFNKFKSYSASLEISTIWPFCIYLCVDIEFFRSPDVVPSLLTVAILCGSATHNMGELNFAVFF